MYDCLENLYTVKVNSKQFPKLNECTKETEIELIVVENDCNMVELVIESNEPDNVFEPKYQEPTYIVYITVDGDTVDRLVYPYEFENMTLEEMVNVMENLFMRRCTQMEG